MIDMPELTDDQVVEIIEEGWDAAMKGSARGECPYRGWEADLWEEGWDSAWE